MNRKILLGNLLLLLLLGWGLGDLHRELSRPPEPVTLATLDDFPLTVKGGAELLPSYPPLFDLKAPAAAAGAGESAADGRAVADQLAAEQYLLRLRGIFRAADGSRLAVIEVLDRAGRHRETLRAAAGQPLLEQTLTAIEARSVTITRPDGEVVRLRIFQREE